MKKNVAVVMGLLGLIAVPFTAVAGTYVSPTQVAVTEHMDGKTIDLRTWRIATGGQVTVMPSNKGIRISGPYVGYAQTGGNLSTVASYPSADVRATVDVLIPSSNPNAGFHTSFALYGDNGAFANIQQLYGSYRIAYGTFSGGWNAMTIPAFGDEKTSWHTYKLTYNAATQTATAYVDEQLIGQVNINLGNRVTVEMYQHGAAAGEMLDVYYANLSVRHKP